MSERILLPLDGSKLGEVALSYVQDLISRLATAKVEAFCEEEVFYYQGTKFI